MDTYKAIFDTLVQSNVPVIAAVVIAAAIRAFEIGIRFKKKKHNE
jgi:hypothetical protein